MGEETQRVKLAQHEILIQEMSKDVAEIKIDVKDIYKCMKHGFEKQNGRLDKLESWKTGIMFVASFIIIVSGIILGVLELLS
jgi:hypothetical protein